jgi:hypothetical protein
MTGMLVMMSVRANVIGIYATMVVMKVVPPVVTKMQVTVDKTATISTTIHVTAVRVAELAHKQAGGNVNEANGSANNIDMLC